MNSKIKWLRNKLNGLNMQGMIVTNPVNIKYLTNIEAEGILLITRKENIFLTDSRYIEHVNAILTIEDGIVAYN
jgi:Xaa-Pro aminopeptidase